MSDPAPINEEDQRESARRRLEAARERVTFWDGQVMSSVTTARRYFSERRAHWAAMVKGMEGGVA